MHYSSALRPGEGGGVSEGQSQWAEGVGACGGAGSLDKLTVLDWLWGRVADVGINFISLLFAPRLDRPLLWREEQNQLYCFDAAVSRECVTSLYSSLNFKLPSVAAAWVLSQEAFFPAKTLTSSRQGHTGKGCPTTASLNVSLLL